MQNTPLEKNSAETVFDSETALFLLIDTGPKTRQAFLFKGTDLSNPRAEDFVGVSQKTLFSGEARLEIKRANKIAVVIYPTRTYTEGFGGTLFSPLTPEDRALIRKLRSRAGDKLTCYEVHLGASEILKDLPGYLDAGEKERFAQEVQSLEQAQQTAEAEDKKIPWVVFDTSVLKQIGPLFKSAMTRPNKQDFFYLVTKTFGINLIMRVAFAAKGVASGQLPLDRAIISTSWYQLQDIVFTIFGQTYMKFLGKLTPLLRVFNAPIGDFFTVYVQFCFFEFLNRLILGPLGENPLAYSWHGIGLILLNNLQGLISGGPICPAINKMRRAGLISQSTMMHMYQVSSLLMYSGLFATFGYQTIYFILTTATLLFAWGSYIICSVVYKDHGMEAARKEWVTGGLDRAVQRLYSGVSA